MRKKPVNKTKRIFVLSFLVAVLSVCGFFSVAYGKTNSYKSAPCLTEEDIRTYFPTSYQESLIALKKLHPDWQFVAFNTGLSWAECFTPEAELYPTRNLALARNKEGGFYFPTSWYSTTIPGSYNTTTGTWTPFDSGNWYQASEEAIAYCMDPRNFLTEQQIFQFFDSASPLDDVSSVKAVSAVINTIGNDYWTRDPEVMDVYDYTEEVPNPLYEEYLKAMEEDGAWEDEIPEETITEKHYISYIEAICQITKELNLNAATVAVRLRQEHGNADSELITGTYPFYLEDGTEILGGYYNYFNIGAGGNTKAEIYTNGLREAYADGWNTRYKALLGGAEKYNGLYIANGQTTLYSQKFNVDGSSSRAFWGQYMQNITAPQTESLSLYNSLASSNLLDYNHTFVIPVFSDMPETPCPYPTETRSSNNYINAMPIYDVLPDDEGNAILYPWNEELTSSTTSLSATVPYEAEDVNIYITPSDKTNATCSLYEITEGEEPGKTLLDTFKGEKTETLSLSVGVNSYEISVQAEDESVRTYTLTVTREKKIVYGDMNNDETFDMQDATYMISHFLGYITLDGEDFEKADINGDNIVDMQDATFVISYFLGYTDNVYQRTTGR